MLLLLLFLLLVLTFLCLQLPEDISPYPPVMELPVQSAIVTPAEGHALSDDELSTWGLDVKGYAWAGGGRRVVRVDMSADGGQNWQQAELVAGAEQPSMRSWAWVLWEASVGPDTLQALGEAARANGASEIELCVRAVDECGNTQVHKDLRCEFLK